MSTEKKQPMTPKKFKKSPEKHSPIKADSQEELQKVEDDLNSIIEDQRKWDEEMLLTPESLKKPKAVSQTRSFSRPHGTSISNSHPNQKEISRSSQTEVLETRNQILGALKIDPSSSSDIRNRMIEQHILSLLKVSQPTQVPLTKSFSSPDPVALSRTSTSFSSPKRDNSPSGPTDGRWAGLSSSPAPHQLPLPAFNGTAPQVDSSIDSSVSTSSHVHPLLSVTPQRLFTNKPASPNSKKENRKSKDLSPKLPSSSPPSEKSPKEKRKFKPSKVKQGPKIGANSNHVPNLDSISTHLKSMLNIGEGSRAQVAH